jgi:hypothetical protein
MKKCTRLVVFVSLLLANMSVFATTTTSVTVTLVQPVINIPIIQENRGVNITIGSTGAALDGAALRAVRRVVGFSVASGAIDSFVVYSPKIGGPIAKEGGISACAEAGYSADQQKFNGFINELRAIKPKSGTVYTLEPVVNCDRVEPVFCTLDVKACPDGSYVNRIGPSCAFPACTRPVPVQIK